MQIFQPTTLDGMQSEMDSLLQRMALLVAHREVMEADLEGYETPGYEHFKKEVLSKERVRIAEVRMTIPATNVNLHERLQGQYNEAGTLMQRKESIVASLALVRRQISEVSGKTERLNKRLKKTIERK